MKDWRPANWINPYMDKHEPHSDSWERLCFERGADAILEALRATHSLEGFERMTEVILMPTVTEPVSA